MERSRSTSSVCSQNKYKMPQIVLPSHVEQISHVELTIAKPKPREFNDTLLEDLTDI